MNSNRFVSPGSRRSIVQRIPLVLFLCICLTGSDCGSSSNNDDDALGTTPAAATLGEPCTALGQCPSAGATCCLDPVECGLDLNTCVQTCTTDANPPTSGQQFGRFCANNTNCAEGLICCRNPTSDFLSDTVDCIAGVTSPILCSCRRPAFRQTGEDCVLNEQCLTGFCCDSVSDCNIEDIGTCVDAQQATPPGSVLLGGACSADTDCDPNESSLGVYCCQDQVACGSNFGQCVENCAQFATGGQGGINDDCENNTMCLPSTFCCLVPGPNCNFDNDESCTCRPQPGG